MPPTGPQPTEQGFFSTSDGLRLAWARWDPKGSPRGTVCLCHGLGEHVGRYRHVAAAFTAARFVFLGFDLRGHGRSDGPRGHAPSYGHLLDDYGRLIGLARHLPVVAYGHSLGGQLGLNFGLADPGFLAGVISTGPWLRLAFPAPRLKVLLARALSPVLPGVSLPSGLEIAALSRDPEVCRAYADDPLVHDRISFRMGVDLLDAGERAIAEAPGFVSPVLLAHGAADRITDLNATRAFFDAAGSADKTFTAYPDHFHEIHNEPDWRDVLSDLTSWAVAHAG